MPSDNLTEQQDGPTRLASERAVGATRSTRTEGALAAVLALFLDQVSKAGVFANLELGQELVLAPIFSFVPGWNDGTAFGLAEGTAPLLLIAVALAISAWLATLMLKASSSLKAVGLGAVIGGAVANVTDRARFGAVRDFIDVHWDGLHWPTFNAADMFVVGGLLLFVLADFQRQRDKR